MESSTHLIRAVLGQPLSVIPYDAGQRLREVFPGLAVLECSSCGFDLDGYLESGQATATPSEDLGHNQILATWRGCTNEAMAMAMAGMGSCQAEGGVMHRPVNAFLRVEWRGRELRFVRLTWSGAVREQTTVFLLAATQALAESFYQAVCEWSGMPHGEVLVFEQGQWHKDRALFLDQPGTRGVHGRRGRGAGGRARDADEERTRGRGPDGTGCFSP